MEFKWYLALFLVVGLLAGYTLATGVSVIGEAKGGIPGAPGAPDDEIAECSDHLDNDGDGFCDYAWNRAYCSDGSSAGSREARVL